MGIFIGIFAFILFYLYDFNQVVLKKKILNHFFFIGCFLLVVATFILVYEHWQFLDFNLYQLFTLTLAMICFILLIYTLFFSLPFDDTYLENNSEKNKCCRTGMYALCRHPGVIWMFGFYLMLALSFNTPKFYLACIIFNLMNVIYIMTQDHWTFMHQFIDYQDYKVQVPFLLPNRNSIKKCIHTFKRSYKDEARREIKTKR